MTQPLTDRQIIDAWNEIAEANMTLSQKLVLLVRRVLERAR